MDDGVDGIDRDRAGAQDLRAPLERRLGIEAGRRGDLLAQDDLDDRPVERADDAEQPLAARGGARERGPRDLRKVRAAGNHRVGGADAGDHHALEVQPVLGEQAQIFRQIAGREGERDIGHRQHHVLRAAAGLGVGRGRHQ